MDQQVKVHVAVPTYGATPAICQLSFGSFIGHGVATGHIHHIGEVEGAYIDRARNDLVRQAITNGSTHVIFVDQDMIIPEGALQRLLAHDVPIVGAAYFGKDDFFTPVAFHLDPFARVYEFEDCPEVPSGAKVLADGVDPCPCGNPKDHLHKVGGTGMGCTLIKVDLFTRMRDHFGDELWFSSKETGEDVHLSARCKKMGVDCLLDGFIQCGHVRNQIVTRVHYDWAKKNAPRCHCGRVGFWKVADTDRCRLHREEQ